MSYRLLLVGGGATNGGDTGDGHIPITSEAVPFLLLALQFGLQPTLNKAFIANGTSSSVLIIVTECIKIALSIVAIWITTTPVDRERIVESLSVRDSAVRAGLPAFLYSIQNWLILLGSRHISPLSVSLLNQTKTLSAAFFTWWLLGKKQSAAQMVALVGLFVGAALIISAERKEARLSKDAENLTSWKGFLSVALASLISGVSSAASERALSKPLGTKIPRFASSLLFSIELAIFGIFTLVSSALFGLNPDLTVFSDPFRNWSMKTLIPILSNASGGILVGIVTQRAGGVKKGVSLILGICFATFVEAILGQKALTTTHAIAVTVVAFSMWLYFNYPYAVPSKTTTKRE